MNILHFCRLAALVLLMAGLALAAPAQTNKNIRNLQREQTALKKQIDEQAQMLRSTKKNVNAQLANLQIISAQIADRQRYVDGIHSELTALAGSIGGLERQLAALEADLADCKRKYQRAVTYMFRNRTRVSKWQFIFSAKNFRQMYRRMRYMTEFSRYQVAQGRIISQKEAQIRAKRAELLGAKQEKDRLYAQGQAETQKLQGQQQERQQVVNELNKKQGQLQASIAQQQKKYNRLNDRIEKAIQQEIAAAERRRKEAERKRKAEAARQARLKAQREKAAAQKRAREQAARQKASKKQSAASKKSVARRRQEVPDEPATATPDFTEADRADRALSGSFAANRGRLPMPITGPYAITTRYGVYNVEGLSGVQLNSKGINVTGRPGAQARCVFKGEVTKIMPDGNRYTVIVRHGTYLSVYDNLSSLSVRYGQQVSALQPLGSVGTDASGNCTLHFQLRRERATLNPEAWLRR